MKKFTSNLKSLKGVGFRHENCNKSVNWEGSRIEIKYLKRKMASYCQLQSLTVDFFRIEITTSHGYFMQMLTLKIMQNN